MSTAELASIAGCSVSAVLKWTGRGLAPNDILRQGQGTAPKATAVGDQDID